jgi:hypothetical protein
MIQKQDLRGRFVSYLDSDGKQRTEKVVKVTGRTLTVRNVLGRRRRVKHDKVFGRYRPKKGLEEIEW